jgi:lipopolysaccharide transport system permease protein
MKNDKHYDLIIKPNSKSNRYWKDIYEFRELFYTLSWKDIKVKYKQTIIGLAWSFIRPFLTMIVFTFIFGNVAKLPSEGDAPYALMVFAALLPWQFFSGALSEASTSLISNANLISKVYFPRMIIPISAVITTFVDFLISVFILIVLMVYYQFIPPFQILLLPIFMFLVFLTSFGAGLFFSALNVKYRDFRYVIPFIVQMGLYVSPVGFSSSIVPEKYEFLYYLNPLVGIIDGFRWCILGGESNLNHYALMFSLSITFSILFLSIKYFRKVEKAFADHI